MSLLSKPSPDLASLKVALALIADSLPFTATNIYDMAMYPYSMRESVSGLCNAAPALIAEIERLRGEVATSKTLGSAEWHEQEASKYSSSMGMRERAYHLKIAAELRKELE